MDEHLNRISRPRPGRFKRLQRILQFKIVRYQWFNVYFPSGHHFQRNRITAIATKFKAMLLMEFLATYSFTYRKTPLMSTSLIKALASGNVISALPIPTRTATPPDAVACF